MKEPWGEMYRKERVWSVEPHPVTTQIPALRKGGEVLDLGVGEGRDALFLARNGFRVTGVDVSETAIRRFTETAKELGLNVEGVIADIATLRLTKEYDVVQSFNTLHYFQKELLLEIVETMKTFTKSGGLNVIAVFIEDPDVPLKFGCLLRSGELKGLYGDWEVLAYKEIKAKMRQLKEDGTPYLHNWAVVMARKP